MIEKAIIANKPAFSPMRPNTAHSMFSGLGGKGTTCDAANQTPNTPVAMTTMRGIVVGLPDTRIAIAVNRSRPPSRSEKPTIQLGMGANSANK